MIVKKFLYKGWHFFYKNDINISEPVIFLNLGPVVVNFPPTPTTKDVFKLIFLMWSFICHSLLEQATNTFLFLERKSANVSLGILINCILIKKKVCIEIILTFWHFSKRKRNTELHKPRMSGRNISKLNTSGGVKSWKHFANYTSKHTRIVENISSFPPFVWSQGEAQSSLWRWSTQ